MLYLCLFIIVVVARGELDICDVLVNFHQFAVMSQPVEAAQWVLGRLRGRSGGSTRVY